MYGVLAEDSSDVEVLKVLIRRLSKTGKSTRIRGKGFDGCGQLIRRGASQLILFRDLDCVWFVVCHDADGPDPTEKYNRVVSEIINPSGVAPCCIVIPVQELEAWILADIQAVTRIIKRWNPTPIPNPEGIPSPKEHLERLSRDSKRRPRYSHATHNPRIAQHLDLDELREKCPSFIPLAQFVARVDATEKT